MKNKRLIIQTLMLRQRQLYSGMGWLGMASPTTVRRFFAR